MLLKESCVHKILVISLTNIGDVILTFPVIDILKENFPQVSISLVIGPKAKSLVWENPHFKKIYIYEKRAKLSEKLKWLAQLRGEKFDLLVDLRNSAMPIFIGARARTSFRMRANKQMHMTQKHLHHLKTVYNFPRLSAKKYCVVPTGEDEHYVLEKLNGLEKFVVIAPGAADSAKRWSVEKFVEISNLIAQELRFSIVVVGDREDRAIGEKMQSLLQNRALNLAGQTSLSHLAQLLSLSQGAIANDSAVMHLASYLEKPVVGIFGSSDPVQYGPWNKKGKFIRGSSGQITQVQVIEVFNTLKSLL